MTSWFRIMTLAITCAPAAAFSQDEARLYAVAREFLNRAGVETAKLAGRRIDGAPAYSYTASDAIVVVHMELAHVISFTDLSPRATVMDGTRPIVVSSNDEALRIAQDWLAAQGYTPPPLKEVDLPRETKPLARAIVWFADQRRDFEVRDGNSVRIGIDIRSGRVTSATLQGGYTYAEPVVLKTPGEASERARQRVREVYGLELGEVTASAPKFCSDPPLSEMPQGEGPRGELADNYGPPRGGPRHSKLAYVVDASADQGPRRLSFQLVVDARDGTVMFGALMKGKPARQRKGGSAASGLRERAKSASRPTATQPLALAVAVTLGGGALAFLLARRAR